MYRAILAVLIVAPVATAADDVLVMDFEGDDYGQWTTTGEAFGKRPARGTLPGQMPVSGFLGKGLVNSYLQGDRTTGTLTSPPFKVERAHLNFLIGGGGYPGETCMNLLLEGKVVRTATGPNTRPGGSEELDWHSWDVKDLHGKSVVIEIVDRHTGGWGHINVDQIVQSDQPKQSVPARRDIVIEKRYLHFPVKTGSPSRRMKVIAGGVTVREFDIELSDEPAFFTFLDMSRIRGQRITLDVSKLPAESKSLERIVGSDAVPEETGLYREAHRPQFHFTSRRGWLNDPNGLVFFDGEYHLFYQHNPYGWNWGNMHWGHAISTDLVTWRELPIALYPPAHGDWAFSGSAFVVKKGQGGFDRDTLALAYTSTGRGECLAFSQDRGRTWVESPLNPVVKHAGRDPKIIWHEPTKRWVMAVYDEHEGKRWIAFYTSADLKQWDLGSRIEGFFECPDLFELPIEGKPGARQWVLYAADGKYVLGDFDGRRFTPRSEKHQLWHGNFYAAQTFSDTPDGRRIQIGWGQGIEFPGMPFNQQMTVAVVLTLRETPDGVRMMAFPVKELDSLRRGPVPEGEHLDVGAVIRPGDTGTTTLTVRGVPITYDVAKHELKCRHVTATVTPVDGAITLRVLVDRGSVEIFANGGRAALSVAVRPDRRERSVTLKASGTGTVKLFELNSIWP